MPSIFTSFCESEREGKTLWDERRFHASSSRWLCTTVMCTVCKGFLQAPQAKRRDSKVFTSRSVSADAGGGSRGVRLPDPTPVSKILDSDEVSSPGHVCRRMALFYVCFVAHMGSRECSRRLSQTIWFRHLLQSTAQKARILDVSADFLQTSDSDRKGRGGSGRLLAPRGTMESFEHYFRKLGFMDPILPSIRAEPYRHVLILGATLAAVKRRIQFWWTLVWATGRSRDCRGTWRRLSHVWKRSWRSGPSSRSGEESPPVRSHDARADSPGARRWKSSGHSCKRAKGGARNSWCGGFGTGADGRGDNTNLQHRTS